MRAINSTYEKGLSLRGFFCFRRVCATTIALFGTLANLTWHDIERTLCRLLVSGSVKK